MSTRPNEMLRRFWQGLPMPLRRKAGQTIQRVAAPFWASQWPTAQQDLEPTPANAAVMGVFHAALGHGTAARLLMAELAEAGVTPSALDITSAVGADFNDQRAVSSGASPHRGPLVLAINPNTALVAMAGRAAALMRDRPVVGYFVWELDQAPTAWTQVGHALHALWSPSRFSADALARAFGLPVHVVPHPVSLAPPPAPTPAARLRGLARIGAQEGDFVALSSFSITSSLARKNPVGALRAFEAAFGASPRHRLVLRCLGGHRFPEGLATLRAAVRDAKARVTLIDEPAGIEELYELYAACDVLLALHRSEGFGLNMAEAMLSDRAVIATGWSGNLDFMDADCAALVDFTLIPVRDPQGIYRMQGARWAEPSIDHAVTHLRRLADNPDDRQRLAAAGAAMARERLKGGAAAEALKPWIMP